MKQIIKDEIDNKSQFVHVMAWCLTGNRPLPKQMVT